ncbi:DUF1186 domain-containing protein [candidate division KSB1 bacterium]|nr:DUF1186 domain-containing protein [candidate division KSB1 bacterium]
MEIANVISELEKFDGKYKREQVTFAIEHQEEITPHLMNILENVLKDPSKFIKNENYFGHIYAFMLLGYFRETKAHELLIKLFNLPCDIIEDLYGEIALGELKGALYQTCGGSVEQIKKLALNKNVSDSTRSSATSALVYAVADGIVTREEILDFTSSLFKGDETNLPSNFWSFVACDICDLCPDDRAYEVIISAYADGLIEDGVVGLEEFEESIKKGPESCLSEVRNEKNHQLSENFHERMVWWACFEENAL